jgi:hypothetical protein
MHWRWPHSDNKGQLPLLTYMQVKDHIEQLWERRHGLNYKTSPRSFLIKTDDKLNELANQLRKLSLHNPIGL